MATIICQPPHKCGPTCVDLHIGLPSKNRGRKMEPFLLTHGEVEGTVYDDIKTRAGTVQVECRASRSRNLAILYLPCKLQHSTKYALSNPILKLRPKTECAQKYAFGHN